MIPSNIPLRIDLGRLYKEEEGLIDTPHLRRRIRAPLKGLGPS